MTEREMFLEWLYDNTSYDHVYIRGEREEDGVFHSDTIQSLWKAWSDSTQREGYKLVPVEPTEKMMHSALMTVIHKNGDVKALYKAMIGAME